MVLQLPAAFKQPRAALQGRPAEGLLLKPAGLWRAGCSPRQGSGLYDQQKEWEAWLLKTPQALKKGSRRSVLCLEGRQNERLAVHRRQTRRAFSWEVAEPDYDSAHDWARLLS